MCMGAGQPLWRQLNVSSCCSREIECIENSTLQKRKEKDLLIMHHDIGAAPETSSYLTFLWRRKARFETPQLLQIHPKCPFSSMQRQRLYILVETPLVVTHLQYQKAHFLSRGANLEIT